jgi:hypothetical protein
MTQLFSPYQLNPFNINPLIRSLALRWTLMRYATRTVRLSSSSRQPMYELERSVFLITTRSDPTLFWRRLVYRFRPRRSKSTVSTIGMMGIWATRQSPTYLITVTAETSLIKKTRNVDRIAEAFAEIARRRKVAAVLAKHLVQLLTSAR